MGPLNFSFSLVFMMMIAAYGYQLKPSAWPSDRVKVDHYFWDEHPHRPVLMALLHRETLPDLEKLIILRLDHLGNTYGEVSDRLGLMAHQAIAIEVLEQDYQGHLEPFAEEIMAGQQGQRIAEGHRTNRQKMLPPPGKAPYGYRRGQDRYLVDKSTAPVVKDFFERFLLYGSLRGAVKYLEQKYGKKIAVSTGRNWLLNPVYRGDLGYGNGDIIRDTHQNIISRDQAAQIDRLLKRNQKLNTRSRSTNHSLAGLVFCDRCGSPTTINRVTRHRRKEVYLYLRPSRCQSQPKCAAMAYDQVLTLIINQICQQLTQAVTTLPFNQMTQGMNGLQQAIAHKKQLLHHLDILRQDQVLDSQTYGLRRYQLQTEIAELERQREALPPIDLLATVETLTFPQFWLDLSEAERRFYLREFITQITIDPQNLSDRGISIKFAFQPPSP